MIYLQNDGLLEAYGGADLAWLEGYAAAVGRLFGLSFRQALQDRELRELREAAARADAPEILGDSWRTQGLRRALDETFIPAMEVENLERILVLGERGTGKRPDRALPPRLQLAPQASAGGGQLRRDHRRAGGRALLRPQAGLLHRRPHGRARLLPRGGRRGPLPRRDRRGCFPRGARAHLLRVLENHTVTPVGQTRECTVNVAVVLATNRDLDQTVRDGSLRADFYDRFRTLAVRLFPLRERPWDIPPLLEHYRRHHERKHRKPTLGFTREAFRSWSPTIGRATCAISPGLSLFVIHAQAGAWIDRDLIARCLPEVLSGAPIPRRGRCSRRVFR